MAEQIWETGNTTEFLSEVAEDVFILEETRRYTVTRPLQKVKYESKSDQPSSPRYQKLGRDYTIKIPLEVAEKLHWDVGSEIYVDVFDEDLRQAVVGKKLIGEELSQGLRKIQKQVSEKIESKDLFG